MKPNNPFFADLSTYSPEDSMPFYENVFGWKYYKSNDYFTAYINDRPVAGLYETPEKFKQMRMPHFWMTYIQVDSVDQVVEKAKKLGGIIEMANEIHDYGKVGLIRDPQGAGFTVYEGERLKNSRTKDTPNTLIWNELHVCDAKNVIPFYLGIFNWEITREETGYYKVFNPQKEHIADILEIPNDFKGKHEYWVCSFGTEDLQKTKNKVLENGGDEIIDEGRRMLFTDNSNEAFFYVSLV